MRKFSSGYLLLLGLTFLVLVPLRPNTSPAQNLIIDNGNSLTVTNNITFRNEYIGQLSLGTVNQNNFANTVNRDLYLGFNSGSRGTYNLSGGTLSAVRDERIGSSGSGFFYQSGGTKAVNRNLYLGYNSGSSGIYNLTNGNLVAGTEYIGRAGSGVFSQTGGSHTITNGLYLGFNARGNGTYTLSNGSLSADTEYIGRSGSGVFTQTGGSNMVANLLTLGNQAGASGVYNLEGGMLAAGEILVNSGGSFHQTGGIWRAVFSQNGGTVTGTLENLAASIFNYNSGTFGGRLVNMGTINFNADFTAGNGLAQYSATPIAISTGRSITLNGEGLVVDQGASLALEGGNLRATDEIIGPSGNGTFTQRSGTNTVTGTLSLGHYAGSNGIYNISGGSLSASDEVIGGSGSGTFTQSGGSNTVSHNMIIALKPGSRGLYNLLGGSLSAETLQVNPGGTFAGIGTLSARVSNRGLVKPGLSVGTLNIVGSYTQTATGTLEIEIESPTSFDKINVTGTPGTATLAGSLKPVFLRSFNPINRVFTIINTTGGVIGTFNTSTQQLTPTLFQKIRYNPLSVDLLFSRDYTNSSLGLSPQQLGVGKMLNSVAHTTTGDLNHVLNTIDFLPSASAVREAYKQISPEKVVPLPELGFAAAVLQQRTLARRITDLRFGSRDLTLASGFPGFFAPLRSWGAGGVMFAYHGAGLAGMVPAIKKAAPANRWSVFLDPNVIIGHQGSTENQTGYDYTLAGFTLGVDYRLSQNLLVGLATGYSHNSVSFQGTGGNITNKTWPLTAYAAYFPQQGYAFASLGYSLNLFDLERDISFGSINRRAKSSTTGHQFNLYTEAGYDLKIKKIRPVVVTPAVSLAYSTISVESFTEDNAGALNLRVEAQKANSLQIGVGGKVAALIKRGPVKVVPQAYAFYQHEFSNHSRGLDARLSQGSSTLTFLTDEPKRDFALVGGNINVFIGKRLSAMLNYNAQLERGNNTVQQINAGLRWNF